MTVPIRSVKFWVNAFIPRNVPGYTMTVPAGPHLGKTMIPGPQSVGVPTIQLTPYWFPHIGKTWVGVSDCYLTDQREFSNDIHAKSRIHSEFRLDVTGPVPTLTQWHNCDYTTECDCEDGDVECHEQGKTSRCLYTLAPASMSGPGPYTIKVKCAASNPCAPTSRLFGDIDFEGSVVVDIASRSIAFDLLIDQFPAFEAYATLNDGAGVTMLRESPPFGNTVMNLPGGANRPYSRKLEDQDGDAIFETLTS